MQGENAYAEKLRLLFDRSGFREGCPVVGIPRCLNTYEEYPFWHTLLSDCGISVVLSDPSNMRTYEHNVRRVMSDNICFPAKLVHAHISDLAEKGVDRSTRRPFRSVTKSDSTASAPTISFRWA